MALREREKAVEAEKAEIRSKQLEIQKMKAHLGSREGVGTAQDSRV